MENKQQNPAPKPKRLGLKIFIGIVLVSVLSIVVVWRMVIYTPAAYAPVIPEDTNQASPYLVSQIGPYFYYHIQLDDTFEMSIDQTGFNDIIARGDISAFASLADADIESIEWPYDIGGPVVDVPAVQFTPDAINVMAKIKFGKFPVVTTVTISPEIDDNGLMKLNLQHVKAGVVSITPMVKAMAISMIDDELAAAPDDFDYQWLKDLRAAVKDNAPFKPIFPVDDGMNVRVDEINIADGKLNILMTPIKK